MSVIAIGTICVLIPVAILLACAWAMLRALDRHDDREMR
jgi:hypothetical protein